MNGYVVLGKHGSHTHSFLNVGWFGLLEKILSLFGEEWFSAFAATTL